MGRDQPQDDLLAAAGQANVSPGVGIAIQRRNDVFDSPQRAALDGGLRSRDLHEPVVLVRLAPAVPHAVAQGAQFAPGAAGLELVPAAPHQVPVDPVLKKDIAHGDGRVLFELLTLPVFLVGQGRPLDEIHLAVAGQKEHHVGRVGQTPLGRPHPTVGHDRLQFADLAGFDQAPDLTVQGHVPPLSPVVELHPVPLAGAQHGIGLAHGIAQRLLAVYAPDPALGREHRDLRVRAGPGGNADNVRLFPVDHLLIIGVGRGRAVALPDFLGPLRHRVAHRHQLGAIAGHKGRGVRVGQVEVAVRPVLYFVVDGGAHAAAADQAGAVDFGHVVLAFPRFFRLLTDPAFCSTFAPCQ